MSSGHLSKEFFELVKSIGESRSKQEEDQIITREVQTLKAIIKKKKVSNKRMKEYLMRMIYVEMLGHDASFAHIHAVNLTSSADLLEKRVGYLACTLTLHPEHEFMFLMVNTIQQDLRSDNYLHVSMALNVVTKLVSAELIPALLPLVTKSLEHANAQVRKRAVVCVHRMHELQAGVVPDLDDKVRRVLCDADPSVMGASLPLFLDLCREDPASFKDLVPSFVSILKQVTEHRLPRDFDYHRMPAPWIQINLLRILGVLGTADKHASEGMYEILQEVMKRADIGINVGFAIVYESVRTVTQIYPDNELLEAAASCISRFIASENHNLKYLGINALSQIVQINPTYAAEHQLAVIECLEDHDETLKRKTLDLLFAMTNPANVIFIVDKLTKFLESTVDVYLRKELVSRITELAEKYAPDNSWYIQTMNLVFEMGGDLVRPAVAHNLMRLIAENGDDTCDPEDDIRVYAVRTYFDLLAKPQLPDVLLQVIAWVIGEFAYLVDDIENMEFLAVLCDVMERELESTSTRSWFLDAVMKISAYMDPVPPMVDALFRRYQVSHSVDLQQRAHEFIELVKDRETMRAVLPRNASTVEIDIDEDLSFLSTYVDEARANGAPDYEAPDDLEPDETFDYAAGIRAQGPGLKLRNAEDENTAEVLLRAGHREPRSTTMSSAGAAAAGVSVSAPGGPPATATPTTSIGGGQAGLQLRGVKNVWGRKKEEPTPEPAAASSPTNTQAQRPQYDARQPSDDEPAATSQPAREARKRSLTEQEILAQQLFAGVGATAGATRGGRGRRGRGSRNRSGGAATRRTASSRRRQPEPEPEPEPEPVQQQAAQHDFLDFDIDDGDVTHDPNPAPVVHAQPAAAAPVDPLDMLWGADPEPAPSTHSHVSSPSAGSGSIDVLEDIFGDGGGASSAGNGGIDDFAAHVVESRLFAPEVLTTPQFGSKWKATKQEVKLTVSPSSCKTPADYTTRLQEEVHFHAVQTIGIEVICAGRFTADNSLVLVHGKVRSGKGVDVTVRASSKEIAQQALGLIRTALK